MRVIFQAALVTFFVICSVVTAFAQGDSGRISVTGQGSVAVEPDMARITLGVTKQARTAAEAVDLMSADLALVIEALLDAGIAETRIQTSHLRVNPEYNYNNSSRGSKLAGYTASSSVSITVDDLELLPSVLDSVVDSGANQLNGLQFDVADRAPHLEEARRAAIADAKSKAVIYASAAGVSVGTVVSISEGSSGHSPVFAADMAMTRAESVPVMAGEITIEAQINVVYAISE